MTIPSDDPVLKVLLNESSLPVHIWYTNSDLNGDLQEYNNSLLINLIPLGMINTFHMWKR